MKTGPKRRTIENRFWEKVDKRGDDECWNWKARLDRDGYGRIASGGRYATMYRAHRFSYELHYGNIPENLVVLHLCDNPSCVNPAHLKAGAQSENLQDALDKGRRTVPSFPGEANGYSKLTENDVKKIRSLYAQGNISQQELAAAFKVTQSAVSRVILRKGWAHIT
jgi:hypothetical protein